MSDQRAPASRASLWWTAALILGLSLACYWPALRGGLIWDDDAHVTRPELQVARRALADLVEPPRDAAVLSRCSTAPSGSSTGSGATRRSATTWRTCSLHAAAASSWSVVLRRLGSPGRAWPGSSSPSIRSASNPSPGSRSRRTRSRSSSTCWRRSPTSGLTGTAAKPAPAGLRAGLALFVCALLTKTVTATLPAALLVVFWWQRGRLSWRRDVRAPRPLVRRSRPPAGSSPPGSSAR